MVTQSSSGAWLLVISLASANGASAQDHAEMAIRNRIANFREIGTAYKCINDELKSKRPALPTIRDCARVVQTRGAEMLRWFPPGSEPVPEMPKDWLDTIMGWFSFADAESPETAARSHAKRSVWTERPKFEQAVERFELETERMSHAAEGGSASEISSELSRLGGTCKGCHDLYREKLK